MLSIGSQADSSPPEYYSRIRRDIRALLPTTASRILEIGASSGGTLRWLKDIYAGVETTGIELNASLKGELGRNVDIAIIGDVDDCLAQLQDYDLMLFLDVLEHLIDPGATLRKLASHLKPGGCIIASVPNIAHLSVSIPLLLRRRFSYADAGILDRTHLRFFVESTIIELLNEAGFRVTGGLIGGMNGPRSRFLNGMSLGLLQHHLAKQYLVRGELNAHGLSQGPVNWKVLD
jgi:2-polyprenyl-3-methyl-5-hydroxy-6-metoxy-1,4-benzoquinol methylase